MRWRKGPSRESYNASRKAWYKKHSERYRERRQTYKLRTRANQLMSRYGITFDQFYAMIVAQEYCCAICRTPFSDTKPVVDHDHATGKVRGVLCDACNNGLGRFKDNPQSLRRAISYLMLRRA